VWSGKKLDFSVHLVYEGAISRTGCPYPQGFGFFLREKGKREMIRKKATGLAVILVLLFVAAASATAEEKTIELNSPGCSA